MIHLKVRTASPYEVLIGENFLDRCGDLICEKIKPCRAAIITDDKVDSLYGALVEKSLQGSGFSPVKYVFPNGEHSKNVQTFLSILNFLAAQQLTRTDLVIALGGGVVGDVAGFAAACYLRGIPFVQIPTTLLAAVDSSVGGKNGINLEAGKNLAGTFRQPSLVLCDCSVFSTLSPETFADGSAEVIKYGMIGSPTQNEPLFQQLALGGFTTYLTNTVARCVSIKADIVTEDELDTGKRKLLNLGHTLAHAIEKKSGYEIPHGRAVAIGMSYITHASAAHGICSQECAQALDKMLQDNHLPTSLPYHIEELCQLMHSDKKRSGNSITLVVPKAIGECVLLEKKVEELLPFFTF